MNDINQIIDRQNINDRRLAALETLVREQGMVLEMLAFLIAGEGILVRPLLDDGAREKCRDLAQSLRSLADAKAPEVTSTLGRL
jgi:hypothetical protein